MSSSPARVAWRDLFGRIPSCGREYREYKGVITLACRQSLLSATTGRAVVRASCVIKRPQVIYSHHCRASFIIFANSFVLSIVIRCFSFIIPCVSVGD